MSLLCRLKNLVHKGLLKKEDLDRIKIIPKEQEPKTGQWKLVQRNNFIDICCSECGHVRVEDFAYGYTIQQLDKESVKEFFKKNPLNFCECCGTKMIKPQESENKE